MSRSDYSSRRRPGIAAVGILGSLLLVVIAGAVLWGPTEQDHRGDDGLLRDYSAAPETAWTVDDQSLPGYTGSGPITVADQRGADWLLSYPSGLGRSFTLVDGVTGDQRWTTPVRAGLGDCALTGDRRVGCAVKLGDRPNGFYLIDDEGTPQEAGPLDDTVQVTAVGNDFLRINQFGRQVTLRTPAGDARWERAFASAAKATVNGGLLVVTTADGRGFVLDPTTGADLLACEQCDVRVYESGVLTVSNGPDGRQVQVYPRTDRSVAATPVRTARSMTVVSGDSVLPVLAGTGAAAMMEDSGHYEVIDPATGKGLWQIADPELSKSNTRACGDIVAFARKDRSRRFFDLRDGAALGSMAPPSITDPEHNLDLLRCVGSSGSTLLMASRATLTAYDAAAGTIAWDREINGTAAAVNGYVVLTQGTELSVLRPG
ncbi:PQQ-binding-like beta-propeller repeat protein [Gordonia alkaliphila]|uniref:Pyrrolo-quinoline quinone repeat domain-containing protein n=1 Tax=Gordonia alkaliphila TaxID=1053547 RepID=A0ABP8YUD8_9ACTN